MQQKEAPTSPTMLAAKIIMATKVTMAIAIVAIMTMAIMGTINTNFNEDDGNNGNKNEDGHYATESYIK